MRGKLTVGIPTLGEYPKRAYEECIAGQQTQRVGERETNGELPAVQERPMSQTYRYYCLDGIGKLHDTQWISADNDDDAIAQVEARHPDGKCEIWQGSRLVAALEPMQRQA